MVINSICRTPTTHLQMFFQTLSKEIRHEKKNNKEVRKHTFLLISKCYILDNLKHILHIKNEKKCELCQWASVALILFPVWKPLCIMHDFMESFQWESGVSLLMLRVQSKILLFFSSVSFFKTIFISCVI